MRSILVALILISACAHSSKPAPAPTSAPAPVKTGAQVMILGVYHFDNPGLDVVKTDLDDHTSAKRQAEIAEVVAKLAAFRPTKILVEWVDQSTLTAAYEAGAPLEPSETEQIGFRLARELGLPGLVAIDHQLEMDFDRLLAAANASNDRIFLDAFEAAVARITEEMAGQTDRTVLENLRMHNDPARFPGERDLYLEMARVKHGDDFAGPDVLAAWYQRNFRIFANLAAAVTSPDDRVLVIYGSGHAALLRELVAASPNLVLVEPNDYLTVTAP